MLESSNASIMGYIEIYDVTDGRKEIQSKCNAIHYENFSVAMANSISNQGRGAIYEMVFGNGGTSVDPTGIITYLTPNTSGINSTLYSETYAKVVDAGSTNNTDPTRNFMQIRHVTGTNYTDVVVTCLLDYGEPADQYAFDNTTNTQSPYVFDEIGLRSYDATGTGKLLTHVIFHPVQKALNRRIEIVYTVRVQSLTGNLG